MTALRSLAADWLPPIVARFLRALRHRAARFEPVRTSWAEAAARCTGYDAANILSKVLDATLKVKCGDAAYERDSVLFDEIDYIWPVTAGLMWAASRSCGRLDVLDFGGALGSTYFQNRAFLDRIEDVRWSIVEQPHYVKAGQARIQHERLRFYQSIEHCLSQNKPNVILLSSVLQYLENPESIIRMLSDSRACCLIIDKTPFSKLEVDRLCIQHVPAHIYRASYPMWILSEPKFLEGMEERWQLAASFCSPEGTVSVGKGLRCTFKGMIFESRGT